MVMKYSGTLPYDHPVNVTTSLLRLLSYFLRTADHATGTHVKTYSHGFKKFSQILIP